MHDHCRLCAAPALQRWLTLPRMPRNVSRLLREDELGQDSPVALTIYQCDECGLVQLCDFLADDYYDDYVMTVSHSPQMQHYQQTQADYFVRAFNLAGQTVLDVGCGDGYYLHCLSQSGAIPVGIEPSAAFRALAHSRGFTIHAGSIGRQSDIPGAPYAAFVIRQVLEHIRDVNDFLQGIRRALAPGAVGLIEVPSLEQALEYTRFYDFFPDHVNYFSQRVLRVALERNGFAVQEMRRGMHGEYHEAYVILEPPAAGTALQQVVDSLSASLRAFVASHTERGQCVAVWGAGAKGLVTLATAQVDSIAVVIDSDPHKQGRYTPISHVKIMPPDYLRQHPVDAVIITAMTYRDEIIAQLQELGFTGAIAVLGPTLEIVNEDSSE